MSRRINALRIGLALLLGVAIAGVPLLAIAQEYKPPRRGIPTRREGAGTRSPSDRCMTGQLPLMALTPSDNFSLTIAKTPVFFWFVPGTEAQTAEFRLLDRTDKEIYTTSIPVTNVPGVVGVQIPPPVANQLTPGTDYIWQFSLKCSANDPSKNPFIEGIVQRIEPTDSLRNALTSARTPREIASVYASAGIWHEAIATLAVKRCNQPVDPTVKTGWRTLLQSVGLEQYANVPLTQSCAAIGQE